MKQIKKWNASTPEQRESIETNPLKIFLKAVENCQPILKLTPITKGGNVYQVPIPIRESEKVFRGMKFLMAVCRIKDKHSKFPERLSTELILAAKNEVN